MHVQRNCRSSKSKIDLPDTWLVKIVQNGPIPVLKDPARAVRNAIENLATCQNLRKMGGFFLQRLYFCEQRHQRVPDRKDSAPVHSEDPADLAGLFRHRRTGCKLFALAQRGRKTAICRQLEAIDTLF